MAGHIALIKIVVYNCLACANEAIRETFLTAHVIITHIGERQLITQSIEARNEICARFCTELSSHLWPFLREAQSPKFSHDIIIAARAYYVTKEVPEGLIATITPRSRAILNEPFPQHGEWIFTINMMNSLAANHCVGEFWRTQRIQPVGKAWEMLGYFWEWNIFSFSTVRFISVCLCP